MLKILKYGKGLGKRVIFAKNKIMEKDQSVNKKTNNLLKNKGYEGEEYPTLYDLSTWLHRKHGYYYSCYYFNGSSSFFNVYNKKGEAIFKSEKPYLHEKIHDVAMQYILTLIK